MVLRYSMASFFESVSVIRYTSNRRAIFLSLMLWVLLPCLKVLFVKSNCVIFELNPDGGFSCWLWVVDFLAGLVAAGCC